MIDIKGLKKEAVLAALYNLAIPKGLGFLKYNPTPMTEGEALLIIEEGDDITREFGENELSPGKLYFDYVKGRLLKVDIKEDELDARIYNKKNGKGSAELVIGILKNTGKVFSEEAKTIHEKNIIITAAEALDMLESTKNALNMKEKKLTPNVLITIISLNLKNNEDAVKEAIKKALENIN